MGQGGHPHGHTLTLLGLGRTGRGEADADHLVDGGEQPEFWKALEVPVGGGVEMGRKLCPSLVFLVFLC